MILVNLVDINVLMLLLANLSRHLDRCMLRMLRRDISCHLLVSGVQPHAVLDTIKHPPVKHPVMLLMQATMFLAQPNRARLLVLQERTNPAQDNPRVTMLMQATIFLAQPKRARLHVLLEPSAVRPARSRVPTLQQDILCHLLVRRVQLHAVLVTIKHPPAKHPAMLLMLATMFQAQPKRARLHVLLERLVVRLVRFLAPMRCQAIMCQFRVNQAQQSA